jgi:hypothetical protein
MLLHVVLARESFVLLSRVLARVSPSVAAGGEEVGTLVTFFGSNVASSAHIIVLVLAVCGRWCWDRIG